MRAWGARGCSISPLGRSPCGTRREQQGDIDAAPHFRSNMSMGEFQRQAAKYGLAVPCQNLLDWVDEPSLDCLSLIEKRAG